MVANCELEFKGKKSFIVNAIFLTLENLLDILLSVIGWISSLEVSLE